MCCLHIPPSNDACHTCRCYEWKLDSNLVLIFGNEDAMLYICCLRAMANVADLFWELETFLLYCKSWDYPEQATSSLVSRPEHSASFIHISGGSL